MALPNPQSPTQDAPRISRERFVQLLKSKNSPATTQGGAVYDALVEYGVEPAFALAQFRVESQYGTSGFAAESGSWGNMLWDANLCKHASGTMAKYVGSPQKRYVYATYSNYLYAILDYIAYIMWYDSEYGLDTIYGATARWIGKDEGEPGHTSYVTAIVNDMIEYEFPEGTFYESGDDMIYAGDFIDRSTGRLNKKIRVAKGTNLYRGTDMTDGKPSNLLKTLQPAVGVNYLDLFCIGPVQGSYDWVGAIVGTTVADTKGTLVYLYKPAKSSIIPA